MKSRNSILWTVVVVFFVIAAYAFFVMRHGFSAKTEPSTAEKVIARAMRNLAIPSAAKNQKNPLPASADNVHEGLEHFADHCAGCHANDGSGKTDIGENLYPKPPDMRSSETQNLTDGEIYYIIANGVRLSGMPASDHSPEDNWRLVLFIRHIPKLTQAEEEEMKHLNPSTEEDREEGAHDEGKHDDHDETHSHEHHHH